MLCIYCTVSLLLQPAGGDAAAAGDKHEITDYAAAAESIQPTGNTLETTRVSYIYLTLP